MDSNGRFIIKQQLGEGSFSKLYQAFDKVLNMDVALKEEKADKHKKILKFEYEILKDLQGVKRIPKLFDFIENNAQNFIVMELLGDNVANFKKNYQDFTEITAYDILLQMLESIKNLHDKGYIHRDIKPTNFVMSRDVPGVSHKTVYMVDFGLAKIHLDKNCKPLPARLNTDFRGTLTYASLNAHHKKELSRRDDLWSFFFVILDLLNEDLPWRKCKDDKDEIKKRKELCLLCPSKFLYLSTTRGKYEINEILEHLKILKYEDRPDYEFIQNKIREMRSKELARIFQQKYSNSLIQENLFSEILKMNNYKYQENQSFANNNKKIYDYYNNISNLNTNNNHNSKNMKNLNFYNHGYNQVNSSHVPVNNNVNNNEINNLHIILNLKNDNPNKIKNNNGDYNNNPNYNYVNIDILKNLYLDQIELESNKRNKKHELFNIKSVKSNNDILNINHNNPPIMTNDLNNNNYMKNLIGDDLKNQMNFPPKISSYSNQKNKEASNNLKNLNFEFRQSNLARNHVDNKTSEMKENINKSDLNKNNKNNTEIIYENSSKNLSNSNYDLENIKEKINLTKTMGNNTKKDNLVKRKRKRPTSSQLDKEKNSKNKRNDELKNDKNRNKIKNIYNQMKNINKNNVDLSDQDNFSGTNKKLPSPNITNNNTNLSNNNQNQIFIINQYNKNNLSDLEKDLINYFINYEAKNISTGTFQNTNSSIYNNYNNNTNIASQSNYINSNTSSNEINNLDSIISKFIKENLMKQYIQNYVNTLVKHHEIDKKYDLPLDIHIINLMVEYLKSKNSNFLSIQNRNSFNKDNISNINNTLSSILNGISDRNNIAGISNLSDMANFNKINNFVNTNCFNNLNDLHSYQKNDNFLNIKNFFENNFNGQCSNYLNNNVSKQYPFIQNNMAKENRFPENEFYDEKFGFLKNYENYNEFIKNNNFDMDNILNKFNSIKNLSKNNMIHNNQINKMNNPLQIDTNDIDLNEKNNMNFIHSINENLIKNEFFSNNFNGKDIEEFLGNNKYNSYFDNIPLNNNSNILHFQNFNDNYLNLYNLLKTNNFNNILKQGK